MTSAPHEPVDDCPSTAFELNEFRQAVHTVVGRWKLDILWVLLPNPLRFGELRRALPGITQHMLTAQLRALEADGLIRRTAFLEIPPRVEYALTEHAIALKPIFLALLDWSRELKRATAAAGAHAPQAHDLPRRATEQTAQA